MRGRRFREDLREKIFTQRVVGIGNSLPERVVEVGTLNIKKHLDKYLKCHKAATDQVVEVGIRTDRVLES